MQTIDYGFIGWTYDGSKMTGAISSPNYPHAYKNAMYCSWKFVLTEGQSILMNVTDFNLYQINMAYPANYL